MKSFPDRVCILQAKEGNCDKTARPLFPRNVYVNEILRSTLCYTFDLIVLVLARGATHRSPRGKQTASIAEARELMRGA